MELNLKCVIVQIEMYEFQSLLSFSSKQGRALISMVSSQSVLKG